jgi:hypothetical protein
MPHLVRWNYELSDFGLLIIGSHCQQASTETVKAKAQSLGVNFPVVQFANVKGAKGGGGIPHCYLFDHTGKCIFDGHPSEAESKLKLAVGKSLADISPEKTSFSKGITPLLDSLKKGLAPMPILQKAIPMQKSTDTATAEEAKLLVARLTDAGQKSVAAAEESMKDDPVGAYNKLQKVPTTFKGTPVAAKATELLTELRKDKAVQTELKARPTLEAVKKIDAQLSPLSGKLDNATFKKLNAPTLKKLTATLQTMVKSYPDAPATQEALNIGEKYGVTVR